MKKSTIQRTRIRKRRMMVMRRMNWMMMKVMAQHQFDMTMRPAVMKAVLKVTTIQLLLRL